MAGTFKRGVKTFEVNAAYIAYLERVITSLQQPSWCNQSNPAVTVHDTLAEHVVEAETREIKHDTLKPNDYIEGHAQLHVEGTAGSKFIRLCIAEDAAGSLLVELDETQTGTVEILFGLAINAEAPHTLNTNATFGGSSLDQKRGQVNVDVQDADIHPQIRIWVEDADDAITLDHISYYLRRPLVVES